MTTAEILNKAAEAKREVAALSEVKKNEILKSMASALVENTDGILAANAVDMKNAAGKISEVMLDRLRLDKARIKAMAEGVAAVAKLPDPVGETLGITERADGLLIKKISVPLGVVAIIYESRPNVTSDAAALALKSGNACVLRAGKEAHLSSAAIVEALRSALKKNGVTPYAVNLLDDITRAGANELMSAVGLVDLLIPRGGAGLIKACVENAKVPCIQTGTGVCHVFVDGDADWDSALKIIENAKCSRPSVCNAMEVCLVDKKVAEKFLLRLWDKLFQSKTVNKVKFKCDPVSFGILGGLSGCEPAEEGDFDREFLDYIMSVKVVDGVDEAIAHIAAHSTGHSDCIVTENAETAQKFIAAVDSAAVYVNASTRFTDGGEFGLGCEMGISTQKLHARGPMGLRELTTYKFVVTGNGNIR